MSYRLTRSWSFESLRTYVVQVIAGLRAAKLEDLAAPWVEKKAAVRTARDAREDARDREAETTAVVRVADSEWDNTVLLLSGTAYLASGKDAQQPPYSELFGTVKAAEMRELGPAKASVAGKKLATKTLALADSQLSALGQEIAAKTEALGTAESADEAAEIALLAHDVARLQLVQAIEKLGAETEAQILSRHPGRKDLVRAILDPSPEKRGSKEEPAVEAT